MIRFTVPGIPIAQPRQRHRIVAARGGNYVHNYTPTRNPVNVFKASVQLAADREYSGPPLDGPIKLSVIFFMPRPQAMVWKNRPMPRAWHTKKPDLENMLKALQDALTGLVFRDDSQICDVRVKKLIAGGNEQPRTEIEIEPMGDYA